MVLHLHHYLTFKNKKMKNLLIVIIIVLASPIFAQTGTVVVKVSGIENNKGVIRIGLYNEKTDFPIYENAIFENSYQQANKTGITYTFENVPVGTYAIAVWHDENINEKIDKNFLGIPTENYGFSKNVFGTFGPPDFEEVSFLVISNKTNQFTIYLK